MNEYDSGGSTDYDTFKQKLGLDSSFMIRFDNPFDSLGSASSNKAAVVNTQLLFYMKLLKVFIPLVVTVQLIKLLMPFIQDLAQKQV